MIIRKQEANLIKEENPQKHIEKIGRICYKSEDKITEDSNKVFIKKLYNNNHHAMLEHYRFIMQVREDIYTALSAVRPKHIEFSNTTFDGKQRFLISFNARALMNLDRDCIASKVGVLQMAIINIKEELIGHIIKHYGCYQLFGYDDGDDLPMLSTGVEFIENSLNAMTDEEWYTHGWYSCHFVTDRGISHEIVRHRDETSFAQESTRYVDYKKDIEFIDQGFNGDTRDKWLEVCGVIEDIYHYFRNSENLAPQWARSILPTCLKTEIVMTAPVYEWDYFFNLRMRCKAGTAHPMMQELALRAYEKMKENGGFGLL